MHQAAAQNRSRRAMRREKGEGYERTAEGKMLTRQGKRHVKSHEQEKASPYKVGKVLVRPTGTPAAFHYRYSLHTPGREIGRFRFISSMKTPLVCYRHTGGCFYPFQ